MDINIFNELKNKGAITNPFLQHTDIKDFEELLNKGLVNGIGVNELYNDILKYTKYESIEEPNNKVESEVKTTVAEPEPIVEPEVKTTVAEPEPIVEPEVKTTVAEPTEEHSEIVVDEIEDNIIEAVNNTVNDVETESIDNDVKSKPVKKSKKSE